MTLKERVIVETYTGYCMVTGEDRNEVYKYMSKLLGRPVYTHELADKAVHKQLQEKALPDFKALCIPDEEWKSLRDKLDELKLLAVSFGSAGMFDLMGINEMIKRYGSGERTIELYELMLEAH